MPVARPVYVSGRLFASARQAAKVIRGTSQGISLAIQTGGGKRGVYLGYEVAWAPPVPTASRRSRRDARHALIWAGIEPELRAELLAMSPEQLAAAVGQADSLALAIGADLVQRRGVEWLRATVDNSGDKSGGAS